MNATQGVIIIMGGALALYLLWNSHSPFNNPTTVSGGKLPPPATGTTSETGTNNPADWTAPGPGAKLLSIGASLTYAVWEMTNGGILYANPKGQVIGVERYGSTVDPAPNTGGIH